MMCFLIRLQLACIIGPNGQRIPGCIRQCLTGQQSQWRTPPVIFALSKKGGVSFCLYEIFIALFSKLYTYINFCSMVSIQQRKRKNRKLKFHRPKVHVAHRRPGLLRRLIAQQKLLGQQSGAGLSNTRRTATNVK